MKTTNYEDEIIGDFDSFDQAKRQIEYLQQCLRNRDVHVKALQSLLEEEKAKVKKLSRLPHNMVEELVHDKL